MTSSRKSGYVRSSFIPVLAAYRPTDPGSEGNRWPSQTPAGSRTGRSVTGDVRRVRDTQLRQATEKRERMSAVEKDKSTGKKVPSEQDIELKKKRIKRAESTLRRWEQFQQEEKNSRHSMLKLRVNLQHHLINKMSRLSDELRDQAEDRRNRELQSRKDAHKEMIATLRYRTHRVEEHKQKIAAKMFDTHDQPQNQITVCLQQATPPLVHPREDMTPSRLDSQLSNQSANFLLPERPDRPTQHAPLLQYSSDAERYCVPGIETLWHQRKAEVAQKLKRMTDHCRRAQVSVSPSVRQCLEIYERRTAQDQYTGKDIPLTDVLTSTCSDTLSNLLDHQRRFLAQSARRNQQKAQFLLSRKDTLPKSDAGSYIEHSTSSSAPPTTTQHEINVVEKSHTETNTRMQDTATDVRVIVDKKKLPRMLTDSGNEVSASLVEFGDHLYYRQARSYQTNNPKSSTFLTELEECTTDKAEKVPHRQKQLSHWHPLSYSALSEYNNVRSLPTTCILKRQQKIWRPSLARVDTL